MKGVTEVHCCVTMLVRAKKKDFYYFFLVTLKLNIFLVKNNKNRLFLERSGLLPIRRKEGVMKKIIINLFFHYPFIIYE
jgi:hypothetical protein